jgi:methyl-accepting chemotaxis protein
LRVVGDGSQPQNIRSTDIAKHTRESVNRQYGKIKSGVTEVNQMSATALEVAKASKQTVMETAM